MHNIQHVIERPIVNYLVRTVNLSRALTRLKNERVHHVKKKKNATFCKFAALSKVNYRDFSRKTGGAHASLATLVPTILL